MSLCVLILIFRVQEVIHITCNMGSRDLPDMYALSPQASDIHIRQIPPAHVTTYTYILCIYTLIYLISDCLVYCT